MVAIPSDDDDLFRTLVTMSINGATTTERMALYNAYIKRHRKRIIEEYGSVSNWKRNS